MSNMVFGGLVAVGFVYGIVLMHNLKIFGRPLVIASRQIVTNHAVVVVEPRRVLPESQEEQPRGRRYADGESSRLWPAKPRRALPVGKRFQTR